MYRFAVIQNFMHKTKGVAFSTGMWDGFSGAGFLALERSIPISNWDTEVGEHKEKTLRELYLDGWNYGTSLELSRKDGSPYYIDEYEKVLHLQT